VANPANASEALCSLTPGFTVAQALLGDADDYASLDSRGPTQLNATGDDGDDRISVQKLTRRSSIGGGPGDDTLTAKSQSPTSSALRGGSGNDSMKGSKGADLMIGDAGDDLLRGLGGRDRFFAGDDDDQVFAAGDPQAGVEKVSCGAGRDRAQLDEAEEASATGCEG
jgi:Ca2+-binding RTX toxin-like protein